MASVYKRGGKNNRGGYWYASWKDHEGNRRIKCTKTTDKAAAERIANKLEADAALRREGVIDPTLEAVAKQSRRTIESLLGEYEAKLRASKGTDAHITETLTKIRAICKFARFIVASDITADGVNRFTTHRLENGPQTVRRPVALSHRPRRDGRSSRSAQAYVAAIKGFTKWLTEHDKLNRNPLARLRPPSSKSTRGRRRAMTTDEWQWFVTATHAGPTRGNISGSDRALLYEAAVRTGLRANELRSVTRTDLHLEGDEPYMICQAGSTKNRREANLAVHPDLAEKLRAHVRELPPNARVFKMPSKFNLAAIIRADLAQGRQNWLNAAQGPYERQKREASDFLCAVSHTGEYFDFHSLRHTCGAWMALAGVQPKQIQEIMRHSTITLTMDTYGHLFAGQQQDAVQRVGLYFTPKCEQTQVTDEAQAFAGSACPDEAQIAAPTGAASNEEAPAVQRPVQRTRRGMERSRARQCAEPDKCSATEHSAKPLPSATLRDRVRRRARRDEVRLAGFEPATYGLGNRCSIP
jgi:integrase